MCYTFYNLEFTSDYQSVYLSVISLILELCYLYYLIAHLSTCNYFFLVHEFSFG